MTKTQWRKAEVLDYMDKATERGNMTQELMYIIIQIEKLFYTKHIDDIRARQDKLKNLHQDKHRFLAFWYDPLPLKISGYTTSNYNTVTYVHANDLSLRKAISPGCWACLFGNINHVRHSDRCTLDCDYCYYHTPDSFEDTVDVLSIGKGNYSFSAGDNASFTLDEAKLLLDKQKRPSAVGWLQKEPLEEIDAIRELMPYIAQQGIHQYLYTNGVRASQGVLELLAEWGLNEIRFNLQSTDFNPYVIERLEFASDLFDWVLIETPIFSKSYDNFVKHKEAILATGITQINLAELQICSPEMISHFVETEGPIYKHRRGYVSPISSRHYTYDLIEMAEKENWPLVINDCSNDTKFFRGANSGEKIGRIWYDNPFELPFEHVKYLMDQILEDGEVYEFV